MRNLILLFVAAAACQAQTTQPTSIFDNKINNEGGIGWTGSISILSRSVTPSNVTLAPVGAVLRVVNGSLSAQLYPGTYQATYVGTPKISLWTVPLSGPVTIHAIESNITPLPSPSPTITASQIVGLGLGSIIYGGSTGTVQLAGPADGIYCTKFTASIPSYYSACGGGGGSVISVFGRTGAVVAGTGDYTAAQVTNAVSTTGSYTNPSWLTLTYAGGRISGVQPTITTGTTSQYFRGDLSLATFPTSLSAFTNDPGYITGNQSITVSSDCSGSGATSISVTCTKSNGSAFGTAAFQNTSAFQAPITNYSFVSGLTGYPSTFPPTNSGDWAGTWNSHAVAYFQTALTTYSTISGLSGYPSTFAATAHNLLSATHGDTTASAAVRGGSIFAVGATPSWTQVAHSSATGGYWKWNGTDVVASTGAAAGTGSCTNQVVTATGADASPTCSTVTSGMVDNSIAATGVDINTSNQVTSVAHVSLASGDVWEGNVSNVPTPTAVSGLTVSAASTATNLASYPTGCTGVNFSQGLSSGSNNCAQPSNVSGTAAGLSATLAVASGGTGTASTLTGLVRGSASSMTAAELSGDATTSGSNAVTVTQMHDHVKAITFSDTPYSVVAADTYISCDATSGAVAITLPAATGTGRELLIKKLDSSANACTPTRAGSDTIDGATTISMTAQYAAVKVIDAAPGSWARAHVNQLFGDVTGVNTANTVAKINGTSFAGTSGHLVSFGAANIPADSGVVAANVLTTNSGNWAGTWQTYAPSYFQTALAAATYFIAPGVGTGRAIGGANHTNCGALVLPVGGVSAGHIAFDVTTGDGGGAVVSDVGLYSSSGTLLAHIGAQSLNTVAANIQKAFVGGTTLFPAGKTYACYTSTGTAFALAVSANVATIFAGGDVSIATTGGALNPSIAPPADSPSGYYAVGWVMFTLYP